MRQGAAAEVIRSRPCILNAPILYKLHRLVSADISENFGQILRKLRFNECKRWEMSESTFSQIYSGEKILNIATPKI